MERIISFADVKKSVDAAYSRLKEYTVDGAVCDPRYKDIDPGAFAVAVRLADGREVTAGDSAAQFAMCSMMRVPLYLQLLTQFDCPGELVRKMRFEKCPCGADAVPCHLKPKGVHAQALRMASLVAPVGDSDGKMAVIDDLLAGLFGEVPVLDDELYRQMRGELAEKDVVNTLARDGYELYDDTDIAVDIVCRLHSMKVSAGKLAEMGATIAAEGYNPVEKKGVFDPSLAAPLTAMIATKGPKKIRKTWMLSTGVPAMTSSAGAMMAVLPGFGCVVAYSPMLVDRKIPVKAVKAVREVVDTLGLNVFSGACVKVE